MKESAYFGISFLTHTMLAGHIFHMSSYEDSFPNYFFIRRKKKKLFVHATVKKIWFRLQSSELECFPNTWMPMTCMPKTGASVPETDQYAAHSQVL